MHSPRKRWFVVAAFAIAMAWVEAAVVVYIRTLIDRIEPYQPNPLPRIGELGLVELPREMATMVMLLAIGLLAGNNWRSRFGYSAVAFGLWDIFYYVFLKVMCGWPESLLDWDVLFLLPLPWWGPVLAPMLIAALMVAWGTLATQAKPPAFTRPSNFVVWGASFAGMGLALRVFMADTLRVCDQGWDAVCAVLPECFAWPVFLVALTLISAPVLRLLFSRTQNNPVPERA